MGGKQIAVCLLALAASAGIFLRAHSQLHNTTRSATAKISAGRSSGAEKKLPGGIRKTGDLESDSSKIEKARHEKKKKKKNKRGGRHR